jgi:hypothetical protein
MSWIDWLVSEHGHGGLGIVVSLDSMCERHALRSVVSW